MTQSNRNLDLTPHRSTIEYYPSLQGLEIWNELIVRKARPIYEFLYDMGPPDRRLVAELMGRGVDLFTFAERGFARQDMQNNDLFPFPSILDNIALARVDDYGIWFSRQITKKTRNVIRKAQKAGITVSVYNDPASVPEEAYVGIWRVYNETPIRQNRRFPHYGTSLATVRGLEKRISRSYELYCAFLQGEVIGFSEVILGDRAAQVSQILSLMKHFDKSPNNALLAEVFRRCAGEYPYVIYGRMGLSHPSLTKFKEGNGFRRFDLKRYFVPLTHRGAVAVRVGLHRPLKDIVPEMAKYTLLPAYSFASRTLGVDFG